MSLQLSYMASATWTDALISSVMTISSHALFGVCILYSGDGDGTSVGLLIV